MGEPNERRQGQHRLRNTASGREILVTDGELTDRLREQRDVGGPVWELTRNSALVNTQDVNGEWQRRPAGTTELHLRALYDDIDSVEILGDDPRAELSRQDAVGRTRRNIADDANTAAFFQSAANVATLGGLSAAQQYVMGEEAAVAQDQLEAANPFLDTAGALVGTLPTLAFGLVSGGTRSLMGLSASLGARTATRLGGGTAARVVGRGVSALTMDIPLSIQMRAADAIDGNRPVTFESVAAEAGTDVLLGLALEFAVPLAGRVASSGITLPSRIGGNLLSRIRGDAGNAGRFGNARHVAWYGMGRGRRAVGGDVSRQTRNAASRLVSREQLGEIGEEIARARVDNAVNLEGVSRMAAGDMSDLIERQATRADIAGVPNVRILFEPEQASLLRGASSRLNRSASSIAQAARGVRSEVFEQNLASMQRAARGAIPQNLDGATADAWRIAQTTLNRTRTEMLNAGHSTPMVDNVLGVSRSLNEVSVREAAERLMDLRVQASRNIHQTGASADIITDSTRIRDTVDEILGDATIWGRHTDQLRTISRSADEIHSISNGPLGQLSIHGDASALRQEMQGFTGKSGADLPVSADLSRLRDTMLRAQAAGVKFPPKVQRSIAALEKELDSISPTLGVVGAFNNVRAGLQDLGPAGRSIPLTGIKPIPRRATDQSRAEVASDLFQSVSGALGKIATATENLTGMLTSHKALILPKIGVLAYRQIPSAADRRAAFLEIRDNIAALGANPESAMGAIESLQRSVAPESSELADGLGFTVARQLAYLQEALPKQNVGLFANAEDIPMSDITSFFEKYGALQDPSSVLYTIGEGSASDEAIEAVSIVYPNLMVEMRLAFSQMITGMSPEDRAKIPPGKRASIAQFIGSTSDPTMAPDFILELQSNSAQTQMQEASQRSGSSNQQFSEALAPPTAGLQRI